VHSKRAAVIFLVVMFALMLAVEPLPVDAASSLVQQKGTVCVRAGGLVACDSTLSVSFSNDVASGNVVIVAVAVMDATPISVSHVEDSRGSSFTQAVVSSYLWMNVYVYYAMLISSGPDKVTVTFSSVPSELNGAAYIFAYEVHGITTASVATGTGSGTVPKDGGTVSTTPTQFENGAFLVAIMMQPILSSSWAAGDNFQLSPNPLDKNNNEDAYIRLSRAEYSTSGVSSPTTFPATLSPNPYYDHAEWVEAGAAFNPAPPSPVGAPVGGFVKPVNKLAVVAAYAALFGLFGIASAAYAVRRRRKD